MCIVCLVGLHQSLTEDVQWKDVESTLSVIIGCLEGWVGAGPKL